VSRNASGATSRVLTSPPSSRLRQARYLLPSASDRIFDLRPSPPAERRVEVGDPGRARGEVDCNKAKCATRFRSRFPQGPLLQHPQDLRAWGIAPALRFSIFDPGAVLT